MSYPFFTQELSIAQAAVLRAAHIIKTAQLSSVAQISKSDKSPVTVADFAAQALLIAALRHVFPLDGFLGEEDAGVLRQDEGLRDKVWELVRSAPEVSDGSDGILASPCSVDETMDIIDVGGRGQGGPNGRFWVMDPIDGTKTFLRGQQYAISLALIENGKEVVGVLCCPNLDIRHGRISEDYVTPNTSLGVMLSAIKNQGVTIRHLSATSTALADATECCKPLPPLEDMTKLHLVDSLQSTSLRHDVVRMVAQGFGSSDPGTDIWSSHVRYAAIILGDADAKIRVPSREDCKVCIWDHAGSQLIATELGCKVTDLDGRDIDFGAGRLLSNNMGMVVVKEGIHGRILERVREILDKEKGVRLAEESQPRDTTA